MKGYRYIDNVSTLALDSERCIGCGMCVLVCPHGVFRCEAGKAVTVDRDVCIECGACALNCPTDALSVKPGVGCASLIISRWLNRIGLPSKGCC